MWGVDCTHSSGISGVQCNLQSLSVGRRGTNPRVSHPWGATHAARGQPAPGEFTSSFCLLSSSSCGLMGETFCPVKLLTADHRFAERQSVRGQTPGGGGGHDGMSVCQIQCRHPSPVCGELYSAKQNACFVMVQFTSFDNGAWRNNNKTGYLFREGCVFTCLSMCVTALHLSIAALKGSLAPVVPVLFQGNCRGSDCVTNQPFTICQLIREGRKNRAHKPAQENTHIFSASRMPSYTCRW